MLSYSLDGISWVNLPGHYRYGGENKSVEDTNLSFETDSGVEFFYQQFRRYSFELNILVAESDLAAYQDLHDAVGGTVPFHFRLNLLSEGISPQSYLVRKEAHFKPVEEEPAEEHRSIGPEPFYAYTLRLRTALV